MKKYLLAMLLLVMTASVFTGCQSAGANTDNDADDGSGFDRDSAISVISREDGSGTRGAFIELFGIEEKNEAGKKVDYTMDSAEITNSTSVMMTNVGQNINALGYISLGSLNDSIKALNIDGVAASVENIKNGSYKIARPFNIATMDGLSEAGSDFITFILSTEGQAVVEAAGYISVGESEAYDGIKPSGKIVIAGSSSVTPVMEKLKEAYADVNPNANIEIQQNDSTTGMNSTAEGICDIGMASRDLKDSELEKGLRPTTIAMDGIAVIVNLGNDISDLTSQQVKDIYTGNIVRWSEI